MADVPTAGSLFIPLSEDRFQATECSRGPWDPTTLHGGPVAALVMHCAETTLAGSGSPAHLPVRMTLDLERPVPMTPIRVDSRIVRPGGKVQVAEVVFYVDTDRRLARASVLAIRRLATELPAEMPTPVDDQPAPPAQGSRPPMGIDVAGALPAYHSHGTEHRYVHGNFQGVGESTAWIRLKVPVLPGVAPTPFQRTVAAADFINGMSTPLPWEQWTFINPDLTVTVHRLPVGEWICVDAKTRVDSLGIGSAEATLFDEAGRIGHAVQNLLIERRP
ncbi:MAG TPA: thioesterase family protein [Ilumatobacteraceae bacterium]|nr:thioesterase family protein [Ilumatobacteraceae bacterium]